MPDSLTCPVCNRRMRAITTQHVRLHGYTTAVDFKRAFGLAFLKCAGMRTAQSAFLTRINPTRGVGHRPESVEKMAAHRRGKGLGVAGKYERTPAIRERIAEGVSMAHVEGRSGWKARRIFSERLERDVWVRSSWEARVVRILDAHPSIETFEVEPLTIPYDFEGVRRRYVPDFLVVGTSGVRELWEVKPSNLVAHPRNQAKIAALNEYVIRHGMNARLVTLRDILQMERLVEAPPLSS